MLQPTMIFDGTYRIEREIGHGGTGVVYLAYHLRLQKYVVIKQIRSQFVGSMALRNEADILKKLHHPYLPQVYDFLQSGQDVYTVIDYIPGQGLDVLIEQHQAFPEKTLVRWLRQLLEVLDYLHGQNPPIIHSDIKPGNIILTPQGNMCLIDFNISLVGVEAGKVSGYTSFYAAPEQARLAQARIHGDRSRIRLDPRIDLYSLAATFYALITGSAPGERGPVRPLQQAAAGRYTPDFLAILDKAMAWNPEHRYRSAKKMLGALERLRRKDKRYRSYVALQAVSWVTAGLLLAGGVYCMLRGVQATDLERYRLVYRQLTQAVQTGNDALIQQRGEALLQEDAYQGILERSPQDHSAILHAVGDCYYNQEQYAVAAEYYTQALETAEAEDPSRPTYFEDAAICLSMAGDTAGAEDVLQQARAAGVDTARQDLIAAAIARQENRTQECVQAVQRVLQSDQKELCARACLIAAENAAELTEKIQWLEQADGYARSRQTLRQLGAAYMQQVSLATRSSEKQDACQKALSCYEALCQQAYPAVEDSINLAVAQLTAGQIAESIATLEALQRDYPDDYRIEMNLAFAYEAKGDQAQASQYGSSALRHWRQTPELDREPESSEAIQNLLELQNQLGF